MLLRMLFSATDPALTKKSALCPLRGPARSQEDV